jgi:hypothetical protein
MMTMRTLIALTSVVLAAAGCYNPAIENGGFGCSTQGGAGQCPDGYTCQIGTCAGTAMEPNAVPNGADGCCVKSTGGGGTTGGAVMVNIPKTGTPYSGAMADPMLSNASDCPDANLEPNDGPTQAIGAPALVPDMPTAKIIKLAICPTGNNPLTGNHDVDFFKVDNTLGPSSLTLMAQAFYDISMGDLDLALYDSSMNLLSADGTSVTNACAAAAIMNGIYYVVVAGANNVGVNRYDLQIRSYTKPTTCPTGP